MPNERFAMRALRTLHGAEVTYFATSGNGSYGSLGELGQHQLIDAALSSGYKYGYLFNVAFTPPTPAAPAGFQITATPRKYPVYGRLSLYIGNDGEMHGADKHGEMATNGDPVVDDCSSGSAGDNERCIIQSLRTLHSAELSYAGAQGNENYGSLAELLAAGLINQATASGQLRGYSLTVSTSAHTSVDPARFRATAIPQIYGVTGFRSFFVDESGVVRGADHHGAPADENDPPVDG